MDNLFIKKTNLEQINCRISYQLNDSMNGFTRETKRKFGKKIPKETIMETLVEFLIYCYKNNILTIDDFKNKDALFDALKRIGEKN